MAFSTTVVPPRQAQRIALALSLQWTTHEFKSLEYHPPCIIDNFPPPLQCSHPQERPVLRAEVLVSLLVSLWSYLPTPTFPTQLQMPPRS